MSLDLRTSFDLLIKEAKLHLLEEGNVVEIVYNSVITEDCLEDNRPVIKKLLKNGANIYALWIRKKGLRGWHLMYIGQRKSIHIQTRIFQHLFKKPIKTGSQLANIQDALMHGNEIGITVVHVQPDHLRTSVEECLIASTKNHGHCPWNIHS